MKYWNCINVPGVTNVEGAQTSAPSADATVLNVGNVEPSMKDAIKEAVESNNNPVVPAESIVSDEYARMRANAFGQRPTIEPVAGTDGYSVLVNVPENASGIVIAENSVPLTTIEERTPEELDAMKYMSADEVDYSAYDVTVSETDFSEYKDAEEGDPFVISESVAKALSADMPDTIEVNIPESGPEYHLIDKKVATDDDVSEAMGEPSTGLDKSTLLAGIFNSDSADALAESIADKVIEKVVEAPEPAAPEYTLDEGQFEKIVESLNNYEEKYFKEIPIKHISKRFLCNITKDVYRAHQDAVEKYEAPELMDPIFLLYPLTTEDPYMAMGKFWDIVMTKILDDRDWQEVIDHSVKEYDDYMEQLAEEENEDEDEDEVVDESANE